MGAGVQGCLKNPGQSAATTTLTPEKWKELDGWTDGWGLMEILIATLDDEISYQNKHAHKCHELSFKSN